MSISARFWQVNEHPPRHIPRRVPYMARRFYLLSLGLVLAG